MTNYSLDITKQIDDIATETNFTAQYIYGRIKFHILFKVKYVINKQIYVINKYVVINNNILNFVKILLRILLLIKW